MVCISQNTPPVVGLEAKLWRRNIAMQSISQRKLLHADSNTNDLSRNSDEVCPYHHCETKGSSMKSEECPQFNTTQVLRLIDLQSINLSNEIRRKPISVSGSGGRRHSSYGVSDADIKTTMYDGKIATKDFIGGKKCKIGKNNTYESCSSNKTTFGIGRKEQKDLNPTKWRTILAILGKHLHANIKNKDLSRNTNEVCILHNSYSHCMMFALMRHLKQSGIRVSRTLYVDNFLISSSLVYSTKYGLFLPSFIESDLSFEILRRLVSDFIEIVYIPYHLFCNLSLYLHKSITNFDKKHFSLEWILFINWFVSLVRLDLSSSANHIYGSKMKPLQSPNIEECSKSKREENCSYNEHVVKLNELHDKPTRNDLCNKPKSFYGDVNLQTKNYENDRTHLRSKIEQDIVSKDKKSQDDCFDSLKRTVRNNTEMPSENRQRHDDYVVAPVRNAKKKTQRRRSLSNENQHGPSAPHENHERTSSVPPMNSCDLENDNLSTLSRNDATEHIRGPVINVMPQVFTDSALSAYPPRSMPLQDGNIEKNTSGAGACADELVEESTNKNVCDASSNIAENGKNSKEYSRNLVGNLNTEAVVGRVDTNNYSNETLEGHRVRGHLPPDLPQNENRLRLDTLENESSSPSLVTVTTDSSSPPRYPNTDESDIHRFEPMMNVIDKIASGERVPPQTTMRYEMLRFCTLRSFPKENKPFITKIAAAGFYYANTGDEVVCYTCARRKNNWRENDDPMEIHRQLNPNCSFLLRNLEVNVPVKLSILSSTNGTSVSTLHRATVADQTTLQNISTANASSNDVTMTNSTGFSQAPASRIGITNGTFGADTQSQQIRAHGNFVGTNTDLSSDVQHQPLENNLANQQSSAATALSGSQINNSASLPKYPRYASKPARIQSYNDCGDIVIPPDSLATSGFFYAGFGDCVRCFQCGVGLRHWSEEDDPWIEHSRWSKDCLFVKQVRGQEFVNIVQMAVQYSQNQASNGESRTSVSEPNSGEANGINVENLMHTDAAQSVLEMGYHPDIIRRAIQAIKDANSQATLSATNLMEKIFEIEDSDAISSAEQNAVLPQQLNETVANTSTYRGESTIRVDTNTTEHRSETDIVQRHLNSENQTSSANALSSVNAGSETEGPSLTMNANGSLPSRASKKAQLLEQKKLKQENEQLKQQSLCTKCKQNDVCIVFLPCGHLVTCETCAPTIRYCSVEGCGKYIKGTVRTYLA
ncbi:uncharacterized protein LOC132759771 [Ruditapes philippinarum]|uniref:uncharacterized protein LOC132759771 n=1 Tax=Ruditapes philippinarum TaxID=129788 RepID=UPI00295ABD11|nr:uncharacterized protein LOC132759771 [Ruditapes philippinarum]XP_060607598.1 uncharacterized protein LOC132759771 [Ruditapes philippinarum]XP_060607599.1 uncharacterized protein LOC132759771 [Ruditapes philippinarum]